jgi:dynactin complex subunit
MPVNYGGLCVGGFGLPDSYLSGLAHLRTVRHPSCASDLADSDKIGVTPMAQLRLSNLITRSLSSRAEAHRKMAKAALFADSSTRTRLKRYNHHIEKAQQLEARALETAKRSVGAVS